MKVKNYLINNWLTVFIAVQPVLDIIAYFNRNSVATAAGFIRLAILLAMPTILLLRSPERKKLFVCLAAMGLFCLLHVINGFRVGYMSLFSDIQYILKVIQAPVFAVCLIFVLKNDSDRDALVKGFVAGAAIYVSALLIAVITGTSNSTYGSGIGVSGWVIDANRCANSLILVTFSVFIMYCAVKSDKLWLNIILPIVVAVLLLTNGTKSCYITALGLMASYFGFAFLETVLLRKKLRVSVLAVTLVLLVSSVLVYPYTPRAIQDAIENGGNGSKNEDKFKTEMLALGYDLDSMTLDEKLADDRLVAEYQTYYYQMIYACVPQLLDDYGIKRVMTAYEATTEAGVLIDTRTAKRCYARFIFEDSDMLTKLVGYEFENIGKDASRLDLENDWTAILYYYGYVGFAMYAAFAAYFLLLVFRRLQKDFKGSLTALNFSLLVCFVLMVFLAQFSGALLRRPNVSVFFAAVLALLYYQTVKVPVIKEVSKA